MWNLIKIGQITKRIWDQKDPKNHYEDTYERLSDVVHLYGEMLFPFNIITMKKFKKHEKGLQLALGRDRYSKEWQETVLVPEMLNTEYLKSLPANTVGAHYQHLLGQWSFEELYEGRFKEDTQAGKLKPWVQNFMSRIVGLKHIDPDINGDIIRANISRHIFLAHDFWHIIFRYNTDVMGEACIQAVTCSFIKHAAPWYLAHVIALRESYKYRTWQPWKAVRECRKMLKEVDEEFYYLDFKDLLESDVQELRDKYNIQFPKEYWKLQSALPKQATRRDAIHPEYNDVDASKAMGAIAL